MTQNKRPGQGDKPKKGSSRYLWVGIAAAAVLAVGAILINEASKPPAAIDTAPTVDVAAAKGAVGTALGEDSAPVLIEVFSDFQCPHCRRAATEVIGPIVPDYVSTGKVKLVYRFFAIMGTESTNAAKGAFCAAQQGQFWPYHDRVFAAQRGVQSGAYAADRLLDFARAVNLDTKAWSECFRGAAAQRAVQADLEEGQKRGVQGTPTFFINFGDETAMVPGVMPLADLRRALDAVLQADTGPQS